jgi:protein tyrosine/serine phosphatase
LSSLTSADKDFLKGTTINGSLYLSSLTSADKDFLKGTTINGSLDLSSLTSADKDFLKGTTINGYLDLSSLTSADKDFLKGTTINGSLYLRSLTSADKDFLKGTTINGSLYLMSLTSADKDFLKGTTINGYLDLMSLTSADKDFLKGTTINGSLYLMSLTSADKDFLKGTTINGYLDLMSLTSADKDFLDKNISKLKNGYNEKLGYCFFDGILSKVLSVHKREEYTIYKTPFEFISQKGDYTAHAKTIKKSVEDLEFKIISEQLKNEPINPNTEITVKYYRLITGACDGGVRGWMQNNNIPFKIVEDNTVEETPIKAKDLLPILEKRKAYGYEKFKSLVNF